MANGLDFLANGVVSNNLLLFQALGLFALTRYTRDSLTAVKAGLGILLSMVTATVVLWGVNQWIPASFGLELPVLLLIALCSSFLWQKILGGSKWVEGFDYSLTSGLLNTAIVGALLLSLNDGVAGSALVSYGFSAGLGLGLALVVLAGIRERLEMAPVPKALQGVPILLISAGLLAMALMGFRF
ncbi:MAG: hypothetical protein GX020_02975 [Firmicutes bacterium]|nr:hypothetical protein [Bacillota bacterium]